MTSQAAKVASKSWRNRCSCKSSLLPMRSICIMRTSFKSKKKMLKRMMMKWLSSVRVIFLAPTIMMKKMEKGKSPNTLTLSNSLASIGRRMVF